jgi:tetratricopeptide (TPR) repeat protein
MKPRPNKSRPGKTPEKKPDAGRGLEISAGRKWAFRLVALLLLPGLLVLLELALRLGGYGHSPDFFKRINIGGEDYLVQNDDFSLNVFTREVARSPGALRMKAHKAPGTFRIFIFGESAAMGDPEPAYGAGRYMEVLLRNKYPEIKFEVVNVAFTAINSHVILPIARECAAQDGDAWIVYMGNNEMVGPFGAATVFGRPAPPLAYARLALAIQRTRVGQLFSNWAKKINGHAVKAPSWGGMQMFLNNQIAPDDPRKQIVYQNFKGNLDDILKAGARSGAKIILNTVAVNLKDSPPFATMLNSNLPPDGRSVFEADFTRAQAMQAQGDFMGAAQLYGQAAKLQPHSAELQYNWGQCLLALTNDAAAREHLQNACDDDAMPFRTDSTINGVIRDAAGKAADRGVVFLDTASLLARGSDTGLCGSETFYEHVHFDFDGSYRLGLLWAQQVEKMLGPRASAGVGGWASQEQCADLLGLTDWNRALVLEEMAGRLQLPPFSGQANNEQRIGRLKARIGELHGRMNATAAAAARDNFEKQRQRAPDDFTLHENYAVFLQSAGDVPGAVAQWRQVHELIPQDYLPYFELGHILRDPGQLAEAEDDLHQALAIRPGLTEGWIELGNVLVQDGKPAEALASFETARRRLPQDAQVIFRCGKVQAMLNNHPQAIEDYREALKFDPSSWEIHYELGGELDAAGQLAGARDEFGAAARLNPNYSRTHFNYGVLLAKLGQLDEAEHEFAETARLEPGYAEAGAGIAKIRILKARATRSGVPTQP